MSARFELIDVAREGPVARVTLNRPAVRNAFNEALIAELTAWADMARSDPTLRVVVLAGAGAVFCAGADLDWMARMVTASERENLDDAHRLARLFEALDTVPVPIIGRLHGAALGGGAGLAAICDAAIAADDCAFGFTEVKLGILPAVISPYVVAKIGQSYARQYCLTGMRFGAPRAREIGLVHEVVRGADLDAAVDTYLTQVLSAGRGAIARAKTLLREVAHGSPEQAASVTAGAIAAQRVSPEGQEGLQAFLERRAPAWAARPPATRTEEGPGPPPAPAPRTRDTR